MPRSESRTRTDIWNDTGFIALSESAQRAYWMIYSQPTISLTGVVAYTPARWARFAKNSSTGGVERAVSELEGGGYVIVDPTTEELFVRSFMRNDGVWRNSRTREAAMAQAASIVSPSIYAAWRVEVERLCEEDGLDLPHALPPGPPGAPPNALLDALRVRARAFSYSDSSSDARRRRKTAAPDEFPVTEKLREWVTARPSLAGIDLERETEKFLNYYRTHGKRLIDWDAGWRNWILKADEYRRERAGTPVIGSPTTSPNTPPRNPELEQARSRLAALRVLADADPDEIEEATRLVERLEAAS